MTPPRARPHTKLRPRSLSKAPPVCAPAHIRCRYFPYTPSDLPYRGNVPAVLEWRRPQISFAFPLRIFTRFDPACECVCRSVGGRTRIQEGFRLRRAAGQTECPPSSVPYPTKDKSRGGPRVLRQSSAARPLPKGRAPRAPNKDYRAGCNFRLPAFAGAVG